MPAGRPTTYRPEYCEQIIALGKQGKSQCQMAVAMGVPRASFADWSERNPDFSAALAQAVAAAQAHWEQWQEDHLLTRGLNEATLARLMASRFAEHRESKRVEVDAKVETKKSAVDMSDDELAAVLAARGLQT